MRLGSACSVLWHRRSAMVGFPFRACSTSTSRKPTRPLETLLPLSITFSSITSATPVYTKSLPSSAFEVAKPIVRQGKIR